MMNKKTDKKLSLREFLKQSKNDARKTIIRLDATIAALRKTQARQNVTGNGSDETNNTIAKLAHYKTLLHAEQRGLKVKLTYKETENTVNVTKADFSKPEIMSFFKLIDKIKQTLGKIFNSLSPNSRANIRYSVQLKTKIVNKSILHTRATMPKAKQQALLNFAIKGMNDQIAELVAKQDTLISSVNIEDVLRGTELQDPIIKIERKLMQRMQKNTGLLSDGQKAQLRKLQTRLKPKPQNNQAPRPNAP